MKRLHCLFLFLVMGFSVVTLLAGDIQVSCEPDLRVYLDDKLAGTSSSKEDGLVLANVKSGTHVIRVEKNGFVPQTFKVEVPALPIEVKVQEFTPLPPERRADETRSVITRGDVGDLAVTSVPQNCVVEIDGKTRTKNTPILLIDSLAPGEHQISFSKEGYKQLTGTVKIKAGSEVTVRGDLTTGKLENVYSGNGSLRLTSNPQYCTVRLLGETTDKTRPVLNLKKLPAGEHRIVVSYKSVERSSTVTINAGQRTIVNVNLMNANEPFTFSYEPE